MKRAFVFSLDALAAVGLLFVLTAFLSSLSISYSTPELRYQALYYTGKDAMNVLETAKLSSVIDLLSENYTDNCNITGDDMDKTILDVLGYLWVQNNTVLNQCAENLTNETLGMMLGPSLGYEVLIGGVNITTKGTLGEYVSRLHTIVSGYELGKPVSGYLASAYISRMAKSTSGFIYFGGYEGDGNITKVITLPDDANVTEAYLELNAGNNFTLWVNANYEGFYAPTGNNMSADSWTVCNDVVSCGNFSAGNNTVEIKFGSDESNFIGGGFLQITYNTSKPNTLPYESSNESATRYFDFPGIEGIVNLYSSFYVPGNLNSMRIHLRLQSNYTLFLNIGNKTVFENSTQGEEVIDLDNSTLFSMLSYDSISNKTIPLRMSLSNVSYLPVILKNNTDVVLTTDISKSMDNCVEYTCSYDCLIGDSQSCMVYNESVCDENGENPCGGDCDSPTNHDTVCNTTKLDLAKGADKEFLNIVLNVSGNRIGLVGYHATTPAARRHNLSNNTVTLYSMIDSYFAAGVDNTCMSCAIRTSYEMIDNESSDNRNKFIVLMSDGYANKCWPSKSCSLEEAKNESINYSCIAYNIYNITVHTIAYGDDADTQTMQEIAACGNGNYYFSNATDLLNVYQDVAEDILAAYFMQTIKIVGNTSLESRLFSDSFIEFNYTPNVYLGYGEVSLSLQSDKFGGNLTSPKNGTFYIPGGCRILDAKVTSYSSRFWTSSLLLNTTETSGWETVFNLTDYGDNFTDLGDPFVVYLPVKDLVTGNNNSVSLDTGFTPVNNSGGSPDDRAIYYVGVTGVVGYGGVFLTLENATDDAVARLQNQLSEFNITPLEVKTTSQYIANLPSLWGPAVMEIRIWS